MTPRRFTSESVGPDTFPNAEQRAAIVAGDATAPTEPQLQVCHGIPGAGKTSGYLVPALFARLFAALQAGRSPRALVTGPSNTALDRAVEESAALYEHCSTSALAEAFHDVRIIRITHSRPPWSARPSAVAEHVEYVKPTDTETVEVLRETCLGDSTATDSVIIAATPSSVYSLLGNLYRSYSTGKLLRDGRTYFDIAAFDEASMLTLPQVFLAAAHLTAEAPLLVAGDHRQLGPIWARDWLDDHQPLIQQTVPYLSFLNYLRVLRGEAVDGVDRSTLAADPSATIPRHTLPVSYRLPEAVAALAEKSAYQSDVSRIRTKSSSRPTPSATPTSAMELIADPRVEIAVLLHNEAESRRANATETAIVAALTATMDTDEIGIISPYNAQRGFVEAAIATDAGDLPAQVTSVDTVNRNQGCEHEIVIYTASASLPAYLSTQDAFFWNGRRLNVSFTRPKKKLVVIASRSSFTTAPVSDKNAFEDAHQWWELADHVGIDEDPAWGPHPLSVLDSTLPEHLEDGTTLEIYTMPSLFL
ncbi:AAA domain-containing protein [Natrialbaceae archaeon GCM10025810]